MIFKKAIPRRTFLRGMGATLALPLLDGMVPAFASELDTAAKPATRFSVVYVPNGMDMAKWTPKTVGAGYETTPILEPLASFRDQTTVLTGLVLEYDIDGAGSQILLGAFGPGEVASTAIPIGLRQRDSDAIARVTTRLLNPPGTIDANPANNSRSNTIAHTVPEP